MCRYALSGPCKDHFACFSCRKAFRKTSVDDLPEGARSRPGEPRVCPCPDCGEAMADMGLDFKTPKKSDVKQWEKVRILFAHGFTFHSCGCCGPGLRPEELREVDAFLQGALPKSKGEALLRMIEERTSRRGSPA